MSELLLICSPLIIFISVIWWCLDFLYGGEPKPSEENPDSVGGCYTRFRWSTFKFEIGRWYYHNDCVGNTINKWWVWNE